MSDTVRTPEEYIQRHANQYCNGDAEAAKSHAIVRAVIEEKQNDKKRLPRMSVLDYLKRKG